MKTEYKTPIIEITRFHTDDVITASGDGSAITTTATMPDANTPQIIDADNLFNYN